MSAEKASAPALTGATQGDDRNTGEMMGPKEASVNPLLSAALEYAARGWPVFPCVERGKEPATAHGFKDATTDARTIRAWWKARPLANVGIATGARSFDVLDVDGLEGESSLAALLALHGPLPRTTEVQTGRGRQLLFAPSGFPSKAAVLGSGLDTRGAGGYVIAPPSIHPNGARYGFTYQDGLAPAPPWLAALVSKPKEAPKREAASAPRPATRDARTTRYGSAALDGLAAEVSSAPEGTRNDALNRAAHRAGKLVAGGEVDAEEARRALTSAAEAAGLEAREVEKTLESGLSAGELVPASAPPRRPGPPSPRLAPVVPLSRVDGNASEAEAPALPRERGRVSDVLARIADVGPRNPLGLANLDDFLGGGIPRGKVFTVVGEPGIGKTMLLVNAALALHGAGFSVLVLCYDEPQESVAMRLAQAHGVEREEAAYPRNVEILRERGKGREIVCLPSAREPLPVEDAVARFLEDEEIREDAPFAVLLDGLQRAYSRETADGDTDRARVDAVMRALRAVAERGALVGATAEMNRGGYAARDVNARTRSIASAAESRYVEYGTDVHLVLTSEGEGRSMVRLEVAKTRLAPYRRGHVVARHDHARSLLVPVDSADFERSEKLGRELAAKERGREAEAVVLSAVDAAPPDRGISKAALDALTGSTRAERRLALERLLDAGTLEPLPASSGPKGGAPVPRYRRRRGA